MSKVQLRFILICIFSVTSLVACLPKMSSSEYPADPEFSVSEIGNDGSQFKVDVSCEAKTLYDWQISNSKGEVVSSGSSCNERSSSLMKSASQSVIALKSSGDSEFTIKVTATKSGFKKSKSQKFTTSLANYPVGTWIHCKPGDDDKITLVITKTTMSYKIENIKGLGTCDFSVPKSETIANGSYVIRPSSAVPGEFEVDFMVGSAFSTSYDDSVTQGFNDNARFGFTDWQTNLTKDLVSLGVVSQSTVFYDSIKWDQSNLYIGGGLLTGNQNTAARPSADMNFPISKQ